MTVALLLIDLQNDYFPGGQMELQGSEEAVQVAGRLLDFFRRRKLPVFHIQHLSVNPGATFFKPGTPGAEIHRAVRPQSHEVVIQKNYPNAFRETALSSHLERLGIRRLVIAGMMTHMCVDATARAAGDLGLECRIIQDACATRDLTIKGQKVSARDVHVAFMAALHGTYGQVMTAEEAIAELQMALANP